MHIRKSARKPIPFAITREAVTDRGPAVRHDPAHPDPIVAAQWDDPDDTNPNSRQPWQVFGARKRDGLRAMRERGSITEAMWIAAEYFRRDYETADGAKEATGERVGSPSGFRGLEPGDRQLDALRRVREATQAVGMMGNPPLVVCVVGCGTIEMLAAEMRCRPGPAADRLRGTLTLLADYYAGPRGAETL